MNTPLALCKYFGWTMKEVEELTLLERNSAIQMINKEITRAKKGKKHGR